MKTIEIANNLVDWYNKGDEAKCYQELYSNDIVSIEADNSYPKAEGMQEVQKKGEWWNNTFEVHSTKASKPTVADNWFTTRFDMDITHKESGERSQMQELGVYQVKDGKIIREQFFYDAE